jgi:hypothetical protein
MDEGEVGAGELVVSCGKATVLLQAADQPFDDVAFAVGLPVHHAGSRLGPELRDDHSDAAAPEMIAHAMAGVPPIAEQRPGPRSGPATAGTFHRSGGHQGLESGLLVALAGGQDEGDRPAASLAAQVELAAEAASGAAERLARLPPLAPAA